jgi:hypothetical protein
MTNKKKLTYNLTLKVSLFGSFPLYHIYILAGLLTSQSNNIKLHIQLCNQFRFIQSITMVASSKLSTQQRHETFHDLPGA